MFKEEKKEQLSHREQTSTEWALSYPIELYVRIFFFLCEFLKSPFGLLPKSEHFRTDLFFVQTIEVSGHRVSDLEKTLEIVEFNTLILQTENQKD